MQWVLKPSAPPSLVLGLHSQCRPLAHLPANQAAQEDKTDLHSSSASAHRSDSSTSRYVGRRQTAPSTSGTAPSPGSLHRTALNGSRSVVQIVEMCALAAPG